MCYVTHGYEVKRYDTEAQAFDHIDYEMGVLTSKKIFDDTSGTRCTRRRISSAIRST